MNWIGSTVPADLDKKKRSNSHFIELPFLFYEHVRRVAYNEGLSHSEAASILI